MILSITGFMGCGKSSVGKQLSELLCCRFIDLDKAIEEAAEMTIQKIFASKGEAGFRKIEQDVLLRILEGSSSPLSPTDFSPSEAFPTETATPDSRQKKGDGIKLVIALGGGTILTEECRKAVHQETLCVYLKASTSTILDHLQGQTATRPLLAGRTPNQLTERICDLMSQRTPYYETTSHLTIDTDGKSIPAIAQQILSHL